MRFFERGVGKENQEEAEISNFSVLVRSDARTLAYFGVECK